MSRSLKTFISSMFFLISLCVPGAALSAGKTIGTLNVGVILPLTGKLGVYGNEIKSGIDIGLQEYMNTNKKFNGKVQLIYKDNKGSISESARLAESLFKTSRVDMLIGGFSNPESTTLAQIAHSHKRVFISLLAKEIDNLSRLPTTFLISSSYRWQAEIAATYIGKYEKPSYTGVISSDEDSAAVNNIISNFSNALTKNSTSRIIRFNLEAPPVQKDVAENQGAESIEQDVPTDENSVTKNQINSTPTSEGETGSGEKNQAGSQEENKGNDKDEAVTEPESPVDPLARFAKLAQQIKDSKVRVVFFPFTWSTSFYIIEELEKINYTGKIFGLEYWESNVAYKKLQSSSKMTAFHVTHYRPDTLPAYFSNVFKNKYKRLPSALAAMGYDTANLVANAYQTAKSDRIPPIIDALKKTKDAKGMLSLLRMGWDKSIERAMAISSPRQGGANTGMVVVPSSLTTPEPKTPNKR